MRSRRDPSRSTQGRHDGGGSGATVGVAIADALWRVVARGGFEEVSLRHVASEAGVSMGLVQHYFRSKEQMLLFALDSMEERAGGRFAAALAELGDPPSPRGAVRTFLVGLLPLDEARRAEGRSLSGLISGALRHESVGRRLRDGMAQLHAYVTDQVRTAGRADDPARTASTLLALADGLAAHLLCGFLVPEAAESTLDAALDEAFGPT